MNYRNRIQYLLVRKFKISHAQAAEAIANGEVIVDGSVVYENMMVGPYHKVLYGTEVLSDPEFYKYYAWNKPRGIECTLNPEINESLVNIVPAEAADLFYAGRLDKASEGLLLLTNDGNIYNKIIKPESKLVKVYEVILENNFDEIFKEKMENGVFILGKMTLPCKIYTKAPNSFLIELTQGMNRQIRRMCFALGNYVVQLKRLHIGEINLGELAPGEIRKLSTEEVNWLRNL